MSGETTTPAACSQCRRQIDWTGADRHRAPGLIEDGGVSCIDCAFGADRRCADEPRIQPAA
jgi:hypothetical protein